MTSPVVIDRKKLAASGLPTHLQALIVQLVNLANRPAIKGAPGRGIASVIPDPDTGALTITLTDGSTVVTGALQGRSTYDLAVALGFEGTLAEWIDTQRGVNFEALEGAMEAPREVVSMPGDRAGLLVDRLNRVLLAATATGLDFVPSGELVARLQGQLPFDQPFAAPTGLDSRPLMLDGHDRTLLAMRGDGLDFIPSLALADRLAQMPPLAGGPGLGAGKVQAYSQQCQSLGPGGDFTAAVTRDAVIAQAAALMPGGYLMLGGLVNVDQQPQYTDGPRSKAYDRSRPSSGLVAALPPPGAVSAPFPLAVSLNVARRDLGLPMLPIVTTAHGIPGIIIEDIDDDPATGSGSTLIWDNMSWYYDELKRVCAEAGLDLEVRWHDWLHGTSAKSAARGAYLARLWDYHADFHALLRGKAIAGPAVMVMGQPAGDASSTGDVWACRDDVLDFCEQGGGILATCEYWFEIADNNVHPDAKATILMQETRALRVAEAEAGLPVTIRRPKPTLGVGVIDLHFDSLRPDEYLVMHDAAKYGGAGIDEWGGFELRGGGAAITGLVLMGHHLRITHSGAPTSLHYCQQVQDATGFADNRHVAQRGLLRSSHIRPSHWFPGESIYRPVPAFNLTIA